MVDVPRSLVSVLAGPLLLVPPAGSAAWRTVAGTPVHPATHPAAEASVAAGAGPAGREGDAARSARGRWQWPLVPRPPVLRPYSEPPGPYGPGHRGVDLGAVAGAPVLSVEEGVVTHAGRVAGRGTVTVTHADGLSSTYEPVRARVVAGTPVAAGDVLGVLEAPRGVPPAGHCLLAACLHLGARRHGSYLDPVLLLRGSRVRLLPLRPAQSTTG